MDSQDRQTEIEQLERWLTSAGVDAPVEPRLEEVKLRARVALDEAWLADQGIESLGDDQPVGDALSGVKHRLRAELDDTKIRLGDVASLGRGPTVRRTRRIYRMPALLAVAAALLFAVGLGLWSSSTPPVSHPTLVGAESAGRIDALAAVMRREAAEEETEWAALEAELTELEESLVQRSTSAWDRTLLDVLDQEIDEVMSDVGLSPEVS